MAYLKPDMTARVDPSGEPGLRVVSVLRQRCEEHFITSAACAGEAAETVVERAVRAVDRVRGRIGSIEVVGLDTAPDAVRQVLDTTDVAVTVLKSETGATGGGGVQVWAVTGPQVAPVALDGDVVGAVFEDAHARYCRLGGVAPANVAAPRAQQAQAALARMDAALAAAGMTFDHTVRTWFYNRDILTWYNAFNSVRDEFFKEKELFDRRIPASTGTGGANPQGAALAAGLLAIAPHDPRVTIRPVPSPLQCAALDYGSSFSRAIEAAFPDHTRLYVSGTASIDQNGDTAFRNDFDAQVHLTFEVVRAILVSRGMDWAHVSRAIASVKHASDVPAFQAYCACAGLDLPLVTVNVDICRDDLLFELELDAVTAGNFAP
jgi:enamine deaminase RidA (YjgF/YER057c/UK114 family)